MTARRLLPLLLFVASLLALVSVAPPAGAAPLRDDPIKVEVALDPVDVMLGDQAKLRVAVTHHSSVRLTFPDQAAMAATGLDVVRVQPGQGSRSLDGTQTTVTEYVVTGFAPQVYTLPAVKVVYETADGQRSEVTVQPSQTLTVNSVLAALPNAALRDIRPPVAIPQPPGSVARSVAQAVLLGATALLVVVIIRRLLRRRAVILLPQRPLTPVEAVQAELAAIAKLLDRHPTDYQQFYMRLSTAVRRYLEGATDLPALPRTTRELRRDMELRGTDRWHARIILGLLDECDAVKWAHYAPDANRAQRALTMAYEIVELVTSDAGPAPDAAPVGAKTA